jgi:hypothetical protein
MLAAIGSEFEYALGDEIADAMTITPAEPLRIGVTATITGSVELRGRYHISAGPNDEMIEFLR